MPKGYRLIDHTADLGLEIFGRDLPELYINAARALFAVLIQGPVGPGVQQHRLRVNGGDRADLMVNWLRELLNLWIDRQQLLYQTTISAHSENSLDAVVLTADYDPGYHHLLHEIKAVTYHQIAVEHQGSGWRARIFFDL